MIQRLRSNLKLADDPAGRYLPSVVATMVFLAVLALVGAIGLQQATETWSRSIEGSLTVQIGDAKARDAQQRIDKAVALLKAAPGVESARPLTRPEIDKLLEPWLGKTALDADLPVPALIDVRLVKGAAVDTAALASQLQQAVPGTRVDDHKPWLASMVRLARTLQWLAVAVVALVGLSTVALVVFATRAGLAVHRDMIEVLHLIGARDGQIAEQFESQTFRRAAAGSVLGLVAAAAIVALVARFASALDAPLLPSVQLGPKSWAILVAAPIAATILAIVTARLTVLTTLRRMT
jgi:cell division transport system permease protein